MSREKRNVELLQDKALNKSTAFTHEEREVFSLRGLLPYAVSSQAIQIRRIMGNLRRKEYDIERYIFLSALQDRNEKLFYQTVIENFEEILPLIYTPTVGQACKEFSHIFRHSQGLYITPHDIGEIAQVLDNWPEKDVRVIVVTDGQRILGLGDLGANGMGIPIGKLALYAACAGVHPHQCLPVMLDVGTNNQGLLSDPLYIGFPHSRLQGKVYFEFIDEFINAVQEKFPLALIQFEDFLTPNAYSILNTYKNRVLCFNDDIQGTAAVALAALYTSTRITGMHFRDLKIMFLGAGSAATGIADLIITAFMQHGLTAQEAHERLWFVDIDGLVVSSRKDLMEHIKPYAHDHPPLKFYEALEVIRPHVLIGATGAVGAFTKEIVELMSKINQRPVIFALSNPTDRAECTAEQAYQWSDGRAVFASGSPFENVIYKGRSFNPDQANNAYIFPGLGLGIVVSQPKIIADETFHIAAQRLAEIVTEEEIERGSVLPPLKNIREISLEIAVAVATYIFDNGMSGIEKPQDLRKSIREYMYDPKY